MSLHNKKILFFSAIILIFTCIVSTLIVKLSDAAAATKNKASINKVLNQLAEPFKKDMVGGATPEETIAQFITAATSNDLKNASLFYDVHHQDQAYKRLVNLQSANTLELWLQNIKTLEKDSTQHGGRLIYYAYKYFDAPSSQYLWAPLVFYKNPFTHIWKIVY